jgi:hypothetical protein
MVFISERPPVIGAKWPEWAAVRPADWLTVTARGKQRRRHLPMMTKSQGYSKWQPWLYRASEFPIAFPLPNSSVVSALIKQSQRLPSELYRSLTWDRGKELADHQRLTLATESTSTSDILAVRGSAGQTKTPTDCCASIFRVASICPCIARPSSARSQGSSMKGRERPCSIRPQLRSSQDVLRRSVEPA